MRRHIIPTWSPQAVPPRRAETFGALREHRTTGPPKRSRRGSSVLRPRASTLAAAVASRLIACGVICYWLLAS